MNYLCRMLATMTYTLVARQGPASTLVMEAVFLIITLAQKTGSGICFLPYVDFSGSMVGWTPNLPLSVPIR